MFRTLAYCNNCALIFESGMAFNLVPGSTLKLSNNLQQCPNCGFSAKILDGTFGFEADGVRKILSAPQFTFDILSRFKELLERAKREQFSTEQLILLKENELQAEKSKVIQSQIEKNETVALYNKMAEELTAQHKEEMQSMKNLVDTTEKKYAHY